MSNTFLFVDANNLIARCHHVMRDLSTTRGERTGALHGFLKGLSWCRHVTQIGLSYVVVVWDDGHAQGRIDLYPEYKRGRKLNEPQTPDEEADRAAYKQNIEWAKEALSYTRCRQLCVPGVEADDLIGIFTRLMGKAGSRCLVYSGDHDMHQLHDRHTDIFDPKKTLMGLGDIKAKWGVPIDQICLMKAMMGDKSDNIAGVAQIGEKRARFLCDYFTWARTRYGFYRIRRNDTEPHLESHTKWIGRIKDKENTKLVERNLHLVVLPRSFEESYLSDEQAEQALLQWKSPGSNHRRKFIAFLERYELHEVLNNVSNW